MGRGKVTEKALILKNFNRVLTAYHPKISEFDVLHDLKYIELCSEIDIEISL